MNQDEWRSPPAFLNRRKFLAGAGAAGIIPVTALHAQTPAVRRGGTLTVMTELDTASLDPLFGNATTVQRKLFNLYSECLLFQDENNQIQPWLAESWRVEDGGKTITLALRRDVQFSDGTPFNADAAKFNLDRIVDPNLKVYPRQYVRQLQSIDRVDDYTIRLNLSTPSVLMLPMLANEAGAMMSPKAIRDEGDAFGRSPVGTGPFRIVSRTSGDIVTERNPTYWRKGADGKPLPYLDGVHVMINGNASVRLLQLQSGAAQLCDPVSSKDFETVHKDPNLVLLDSPLGTAFVLSFNVTKPPFDNVNLRKALSLAIDREALVKVVTRGTGTVLTGIEPPSSWVFDASLKGHVYNPDMAKQLLAQAGNPGPFTITVQHRDDDSQTAELLQQMFKRVGVELKIEVLERLAWVEKVLSSNFQLVLSASPLQRPDVHTQYTFAYSRTATTNYSGFKNEQIFALVDQAAVELDRDKRKAIYVQIQQLVLDNYYQSFLFWNPRREVASRHLHGIRYDGTTIWLYDQMWLDA